GKLFPDTDEKYRNIDSKNLLESVARKLADNNWSVGNVDLVVITESPKISAYSEKMSEVIAEILSVAPGAVSIKGTTSERLGFTGRGEGIACMATAMIRRKVS
ncbi:MAG: 2-C-methyl-D-erythritol 2,4-cyclodiphosphate synthase, partial [candidate division Zixibacteria bacterium]|nr:2-C-methyl-D-erythritol 2,4-cyclodiphosphate synthase [candidate division Zixibacteria bacterium]